MMIRIPCGARGVNVQNIGGLVYLASPKPTFGTRLYARMVGRAWKYFPRAGVIKAHGMFRDDDDWLHRWPFMLPSLAALAFFAEPDGTVGMGVAKEVADALALCLPVYFLDDRGRIFGSDSFELVPHAERSPRRFARVALRES
jgi:hypothetical protein